MLDNPDVGGGVESIVLSTGDRAELLLGVFNEEDITRYLNDVEDRAKAYSEFPPARIIELEGKSVADLVSDWELPARARVLSRLADIAVSNGFDISGVQTQKVVNERPAHSDAFRCLTFIVVTGSVKYRINGWGFARHHFRYDEVDASKGDVLFINNLSRSAYKRPRHQSIRPVGPRIIWDFFVDSSHITPYLAFRKAIEN